MSLLALVVAAMSAVFAGLAWWQTKRQADLTAAMSRNDNQRRADEVRAAQEQARRQQQAHVIPVMEPKIDPQGRNVRELRIKNIGLALAREADIRIEAVQGVPGAVPRWARLAQACDLPAGQSAKLVHVSRSMGSAAEVMIVTSWLDGDGSHELPTRFPLT